MGDEHDRTQPLPVPPAGGPESASQRPAEFDGLADDLVDDLLDSLDRTFEGPARPAPPGEPTTDDVPVPPEWTSPEPAESSPSQAAAVNAQILPSPAPTGRSSPAGTPEAEPVRALTPFADLAVPAAPPPPRLERTARILVVSDDISEAAAVRHMLQQLGAEAREVSLASLADAQGFGWDLLWLCIDGHEASRDGGLSRVRKTSAVPVPMILMAPMPLAPPSPEVRACVEAPPLPEEAAEAIGAVLWPDPTRTPASELPTQGLPRVADSVQTQALPASAPPTAFDAVMVRAVVQHGPDDRSRGRIRSASPDGTVQVDLKRPLPPATAVSVQFPGAGPAVGALQGRVRRGRQGRVELDLTVPDAARGPWIRHLERLADPAQAPAEPVVIDAAPAGVGSHADGETSTPEELLELWNEARDRLDDDALQQRFIQACLRSQQLELAIRCYRQMKEADPTNERAARYLNQVGTILGFYAFRTQAAEPDEMGLPKSVKLALGLFVGAAIFLGVIALIVS